ncbi:MAG: hypothetical protein A2941_01915 [Candidatus Yanofskybacteria bacterium RIFCSPLOWO2_01_FULL_49_17]|uniref:Uncharacterized protein n=1 Tax=Candidatus Yanofskybacteria bacterium RIFCSPLOWO2_01_FULL_49_17 TaxID=1802700 RepID=A0A1F8GS73_9BACT|nr:MAG: hypothetical protein A2941_01915 [Candidatus Yanofskybacteria bacterium RIFCSPLOWO2_01_FULL_49_17]
MTRNLQVIIITVLVTLGSVGSFTEWNRSVARAEALTELNYVWPTLKTETAKTAAVVKANTIIEQNRSLFDLSSSGAAEGAMLIKQDSRGKWIRAK